MRLKLLALAGALFPFALLGGCVSEDQATHEPAAKSQKSIPDKNPEADSPYTKDQKEQKAVEADEASSKG